MSTTTTSTSADVATTVTSGEGETTLSNLVETLNVLNDTHDAMNEDERADLLVKKRVLAVNMALNDLLASADAQANILAGTQKAAREGRKTFRLSQWTLTEGRHYNGCWLLDMLNRGDLLTRMQDWLNENCSEGLRVFYHPLKRKSNNAPTTFALALSWDTDRFNELEEIIENNRQSAQRRQENRQDRQDGDRRPNFTRRPRRDDRGGDRRNYQRGGDRRDDRRGDDRRGGYRGYQRRDDRGGDERPRHQFGRAQDFNRRRRTDDE